MRVAFCWACYWCYGLDLAPPITFCLPSLGVILQGVRFAFTTPRRPSPSVSGRDSETRFQYLLATGVSQGCGPWFSLGLQAIGTA